MFVRFGQRFGGLAFGRVGGGVDTVGVIGKVAADARHARAAHLRRMQLDRGGIVHDAVDRLRTVRAHGRQQRFGGRDGARTGFDERAEVRREGDPRHIRMPLRRMRKVYDKAVEQRTHAPFISEHDDLHGATYGGCERFFL